MKDFWKTARRFADLAEVYCWFELPLPALSPLPEVDPPISRNPDPLTSTLYSVCPASGEFGHCSFLLLAPAISSFEKSVWRT